MPVAAIRISQVVFTSPVFGSPELVAGVGVGGIKVGLVVGIMVVVGLAVGEGETLG